MSVKSTFYQSFLEKRYIQEGEWARRGDASSSVVGAEGEEGKVIVPRKGLKRAWKSFNQEGDQILQKKPVTKSCLKAGEHRESRR